MKFLKYFCFAILVLSLVSGCTKNPSDIMAPVQPTNEAKIYPVTFSSDQDSTAIEVFLLSGSSVDMDNPATPVFFAPAAMSLPEGQYVATANRERFRPQVKAFSVVPSTAASVEFQMQAVTAVEPEHNLSLFVTFTKAMPDSFFVFEWQGEWSKRQTPEMRGTMEIRVAKNTLYYVSAFKFGGEKRQTVFIAEQSVSVDLYLPEEVVTLTFGSEIPATCFLRPANSDSGEVFIICSSTVTKKLERFEFYWTSFVAEDGQHIAPSQLIFADKEQVVQPAWSKLPAPPDTVQVAVYDTVVVTLRDTTTITLHDTTVVHDTLTVALNDTVWQYITIRDTMWLNDTTFVFIHDTTVVHNTIVIHDTTIVVDTLVVVDLDTIFVTQFDTVWVTQHDTTVVHDTTYVYQKFYRERIIDLGIQGDIFVTPKDGYRIVTRRFTTMFDGLIYIWGREVRGPEGQENEVYMCTIRQVSTGQVLGSLVSTDTGTGETIRLMAKSDITVPEGTEIEVEWKTLADVHPESVHFPEAIVQNFDPEL